MEDDMKLQGKVVVVTGGAQGIGLSIAKEMVSWGAKVALLDMNPEALEAAVAEMGPDNAMGAVCNVSVQEEVTGAFDKVIESFGQVDVAILNAGILRDGMLVKVDRETGKVKSRMSLDQWQTVIDVNLTGVFLTGQEAAVRMIDRGEGGVIVPISSIARHGNVGQSNYSAAKAGVVALTNVWGRELSRYKIRVAAVSPGVIATPMVLKGMRPEIIEMLNKRIPIGRLGTPEEIAHSCRYIIENDMMTATVLEPSGGLNL
jgi:3-oxoacyl-[acyl-carrier protein] reductase